MRFALMTAAAVATTAIAMPAAAKTFTYTATLTGTSLATPTGSPARGKAIVRVDTKSKRVSVDLDITGMTLDQLNDNLQKAPVGPIHFHEYRTADDVELALPLPYGKSYVATKNGFRVTVRDYDYAAGAKLLEQSEDFEDFVNGLNAGRIILNVLTDKFPNGEISGKVMPK